MSLLLENNAEPDQESRDDGSTPLFVSARNCHHSIVELLLKHGADHSKALTVDATDVQRISERADAAASRAANVPKPADIAAKDMTVEDHRAEIDRSGLAMMTQMFANEMATLLEAQRGDTPLIAAIQNNDANVVNLLLAANADPDQICRSKTQDTPLDLAIQIDAHDCVHAIQEYKAATAKQDSGVQCG